MPGLFLNKSLEEFCESLSLAHNHPINVFVKWYDFGDAKEFVEVAVRHEISTWSLRKPKELQQDFWNDAVNKHHERFTREGVDNSLELAIRRWKRSKTAQCDVDKLIELRIALEALFGLDYRNEKSFRLSLFSAWYLGEDYEGRETIFQTIKKFYDLASTVVHAGTPKEIQEELITDIQNLCRSGILKRLSETKKTKWTELSLGRGPDSFLASMNFCK